MKKWMKAMACLLAVCILISSMMVPAFAADVAVAGGASAEEATEVTTDTEYVVTLSSAGTKYWFKFTTPDVDTYYYLISKNISTPAHSVGSYANLYAEICTAAGEVITYNRHVRADKNPNYVYCSSRLEPNTTYYVRIYSNEGGDYPGYFKFQLKYREDIDENTKAEATDIALNQKYARTLDGYGDVDWFRFTTGETGVYAFYGKNVGIDTHTWNDDCYFRITLFSQYDESIQDIRMRPGEQGLYVLQLEPNTTYYIQAKNYWSGDTYTKLTQNGTYLFSIGFPTLVAEDVTFEEQTYTYDGNKKTPAVSVVYNRTTLEKGVDYKVQYSNNVNAGTMKVTVQGIGIYTGTVTKTYTIAKQKIAADQITLSATKLVANGNVRTPGVTVKNAAGETLTKGTDYTVTYASGRKAVGRYSVKVTMKGNYSGSSTKYFTIVPKKAASATAVLRTRSGGYDDVKFSWSKAEGATGYRVYYKKSTSSSWTKIGDTTNRYIYKNDLSDGVKYNFKVVPYYKASNGTKYMSTAQYTTASVTTLKKLSKPTVVTSGTKVKVSWNNIAGESGYQISRSTSSTGTNIVATITSTTAKSKLVSATNNVKYYYKVRAFKTVNGTKVYGPWSSVKEYTR